MLNPRLRKKKFVELNEVDNNVDDPWTAGKKRMNEVTRHTKVREKARVRLIMSDRGQQ